MEKIIIALIDDEKSYFELFHKNKYIIDMIKRGDVEFREYLFDGSSSEELNNFINEMMGIDLVLVDYDMPQFNGIEVVSVAQEHIDPIAIGLKPTFLLNSKFWTNSEMVVKMMKAGVVDCVTFDKYDFASLAKFIIEHMQNKEKEKAVISKYRNLVSAGLIL